MASSGKRSAASVQPPAAKKRKEQPAASEEYQKKLDDILQKAAEGNFDSTKGRKFAPLKREWTELMSAARKGLRSMGEAQKESLQHSMTRLEALRDFMGHISVQQPIFTQVEAALTGCEKVQTSLSSSQLQLVATLHATYLLAHNELKKCLSLLGTSGDTFRGVTLICDETEKNKICHALTVKVLAEVFPSKMDGDIESKAKEVLAMLELIRLENLPAETTADLKDLKILISDQPASEKLQSAVANMREVQQITET